jgi:hypothetical protein
MALNRLPVVPSGDSLEAVAQGDKTQVWKSAAPIRGYRLPRNRRRLALVVGGVVLLAASLLTWQDSTTFEDFGTAVGVVNSSGTVVAFGGNSSTEFIAENLSGVMELLTSTDRGVSWSLAANLPSPQEPWSSSPSSYAFAVAGSDLLLVDSQADAVTAFSSSDGGSTWVVGTVLGGEAGGLGGEMKAALQGDAEAVLCSEYNLSEGQYAPVALISEDGGSTWTTIGWIGNLSWTPQGGDDNPGLVSSPQGFVFMVDDDVGAQNNSLYFANESAGYSLSRPVAVPGPYGAIVGNSGAGAFLVEVNHVVDLSAAGWPRIYFPIEPYEGGWGDGFSATQVVQLPSGIIALYSLGGGSGTLSCWLWMPGSTQLSSSCQDWPGETSSQASACDGCDFGVALLGLALTSNGGWTVLGYGSATVETPQQWLPSETPFEYLCFVFPWTFTPSMAEVTDAVYSMAAVGAACVATVCILRFHPHFHHQSPLGGAS